MTRDRGAHFRIIHEVCNTVIKYCRVSPSLGKRPLLWRMWPMDTGPDGNEHVVFDRQKVEVARPRSRWVIDLDAFVNFFEIASLRGRDFLLIPNGSEAPYDLAGNLEI